MGRNKTKAKKIKLGKESRHTRWAPIWIIPKINNGIKKIHPMRYTTVKRTWRRKKIKD